LRPAKRYSTIHGARDSKYVHHLFFIDHEIRIRLHLNCIWYCLFDGWWTQQACTWKSIHFPRMVIVPKFKSSSTYYLFVVPVRSSSVTSHVCKRCRQVNPENSAMMDTCIKCHGIICFAKSFQIRRLSGIKTWLFLIYAAQITDCPIPTCVFILPRNAITFWKQHRYTFPTAESICN